MQRVKSDPNHDAVAGRPGPDPDHARAFVESLSDQAERKRLAKLLAPASAPVAGAVLSAAHENGPGAADDRSQALEAHPFDER